MRKHILLSLTVFILVRTASAEKPSAIGLLRFETKYWSEMEKALQQDRICITGLFMKEKDLWTVVPPDTAKAPCTNLTLRDRNWQLLENGASRDPLKFAADPRNPNAFLDDDSTNKVESRLSKRNLLGLDLLAVTSTQAVRDPQGWSRIQVPDQIAQRLKDQFIATFKTKQICTINKNDPPWATLSATKMPLNSGDLNVEPRAFKATNGDMIAGVRINSGRCLTDTYTVDPYLQKHWYSIRNDVVREIELQAERNSEPIDAADFDGDGKSEWIFRNDAGGGGGDGSDFILVNSELNILLRTHIYLQSLTLENDPK